MRVGVTLALLILFATPATAGAAGTLDQSNTAPLLSAAFGMGTANGSESRTAQTFTAGLSGGLDQVDLQVGKFGFCSGASGVDLTVQITTVSAGLPTSTVLGSGTIPEASVPTGNSASSITSAPLTTPAAVAAGTSYAIVLSAPGATCTESDPFGGGSEYPAYLWGAGYDNGVTNTYPSGSAVSSSDGGATWISAPNYDLIFKTYVSPLPTTLETTASSNVTIGGQVHDTATLSGGVSPTGTITFKLYGPDDADCSGTPAFTDIKNVSSGNGAYDSANFTPTAAGTYRWTADYSGDASNAASSSACNAANESVTVAKHTTTLTTNASGDVTIGGQVHDTATLSGGVSPTGTITFKLYGPDDADCSGGAVFTDTVNVNGNGGYESGAFTPSAAGTYRWVADYSGDVANNPAASTCNAPGELVLVSARGDDDTTPPETRFLHVPIKPDPKISYFTFASSERGSTFMCSLNRKRFKHCDSPVMLKDLKPGRYRFRVFAIDRAGNRDPTPAHDRFRVDDPDKGPSGNPNP